ncbi:hypothetical protein ABVK25_008035 [Lepraria finkii]|uniref:Uncharacterized protein n=1 Tax=Lepraria finkii TaxID=1340010 RepID=A0ABR4B3N6_9LECA
MTALYEIRHDINEIGVAEAIRVAKCLPSLSETGNEISDGIVCIALRQTYSKVSVTFGTHPLILASIFSKPRPQHLSSAIYPSTQSQRKGFHPSNAPYKHRSP